MFVNRINSNKILLWNSDEIRCVQGDVAIDHSRILKESRVNYNEVA